jgi:hypothetical protein
MRGPQSICDGAFCGEETQILHDVVQNIGAFLDFAHPEVNAGFSYFN